MELRTRRGRPKRGDPPATTRKVSVKLPVELLETLEALASEHGRPLHAEMRAALVFWAEAHRAGESAPPADPPVEKPPKP